MRSLILLFLLTASAFAGIGDFILLEQTTDLGRTIEHRWPKGANMLFGTGADSKPTAYGLGTSIDVDEDGNLVVTPSPVAVGDVTGLQGLLDGKVSLSGSYTNPSWLVSIPFSKVTSFQTDVFKLTSATNSLAGGEVGLGWVTSRLTLQGGGGSLQWYQSGADKIMAWSGIIQAATMNLTSVSIFVTAPVSPTSAGEAGQMAFDESFVYVCVALNTWKRAALSSW